MSDEEVRAARRESRVDMCISVAGVLFGTAALVMLVVDALA